MHKLFIKQIIHNIMKIREVLFERLYRYGTDKGVFGVSGMQIIQPKVAIRQKRARKFFSCQAVSK